MMNFLDREAEDQLLIGMRSKSNMGVKTMSGSSVASFFQWQVVHATSYGREIDLSRYSEQVIILSNSRLIKVIFVQSERARSNLSFRETIVANSKFKDLVLGSVQFNLCLIVGSALENVKIESALFVGAELIEVDMSNIIMGDVSFKDAKLINVNFQGAQFDHRALLEALVVDSATRATLPAATVAQLPPLG